MGPVAGTAVRSTASPGLGRVVVVVARGAVVVVASIGVTTPVGVDVVVSSTTSVELVVVALGRPAARTSFLLLSLRWAMPRPTPANSTHAAVAAAVTTITVIVPEGRFG